MCVFVCVCVCVCVYVCGIQRDKGGVPSLNNCDSLVSARLCVHCTWPTVLLS